MTPQDPPASEAGQGQQRNVHALIGKVFSRKHLARAWEQFTKNRGSAGIDEVTMAQCEDRPQYDVELLHRKRRAGTSQPKPVKRVQIPKSEGGVRKLGIPRVVDRVGLPALVQRMEPIFEPTFLDNTVGYRAGRAPHNAMPKVWQALKAGYGWMVEADLRQLCETMDQAKLIDVLAAAISAGRQAPEPGSGSRAGCMM